MMRDWRDRGLEGCSTTLLQICACSDTRDTRDTHSLSLSLSHTCARMQMIQHTVYKSCSRPLMALLHTNTPFPNSFSDLWITHTISFRVIPSCPQEHTCANTVAVSFHHLSSSLSGGGEDEEMAPIKHIYLICFPFCQRHFFITLKNVQMCESK